ncbi:hypothetical protein [Micromonospora sp. 4G55]|uniref:hypothetical protein n=1 Tax=Micromonospora sp. 4G55 TaxID=2806102 RepID=UPI001A4E0401|nr:hypothetical protein [Micromonospora sp. 4G55]MBM0255516.1 hypothetical protein [Micromonospora sp. 4G55]
MKTSLLTSEAPKVTDWIQAWGTIGGAVFGALAVLAAALLLRHEARSRSDERRDTEARQARLIFVRLGLGGGNHRTGMTSVTYEIKNYSDGPIFGLSMTLTRSDREDDCFSDPVNDIDPGSVMKGKWKLDPPVAWEDGESAPPLGWISSHIEFMDSAGVVWGREDREPPVRHIWPREPGLVGRYRARRVLREQRRQLDTRLYGP